MSEIERLAQHIKGCKNPVRLGITLGRVIEAPPEHEKVKIAVDVRDEAFTFDKFVSLCGSTFKVGDRVAVQFSEDNSIVYVLGSPLFFGGEA